MNQKLKLLLFLFLLGVFARVHAQNGNPIISRNLKALQNYADANPIEKVHLHLDRQLYFPGDTIWFKAYIVLGEYHKLSALSGILYAELISPEDSVVKRLVLKVGAGTSPGDFELPYSVEPGKYRIRAYTNYMRNAGPDYFYDQQVTVAGFSAKGDSLVVKPATAGNKLVRPAPDKIDLQFFPEGGDLVNGLRSKVAFKAVNQNGLSEEVQGTITDTEGNEVASFNSVHLGMGVFPLEPQKGKQYTANVTAADGSKFTIPLPAAKDMGFILSVNSNIGDSLYVKVAARGVRDTAFYLIAQSGGKNYFTAASKLLNNISTAYLPKSRFPSGILQFTLFSQSGEPLNERIVFIQNKDQLNLKLTTGKQVYAPGEKVKVELDANDAQGGAAAGTFSVSVIDQSRAPVDEDAESTIFTDLLLKSELGGNIESPNYYFINSDDETRANLDLLMLTQGYRRFDWAPILADKTKEVAYQPEKTLSLAGMVKTMAGKPLPGVKVSLASLKQMIALDTIADANGGFKFDNLPIVDTATLYLRTEKENRNQVEIKKADYPPITKLITLGADTTINAIKPAVVAEIKKQIDDAGGSMKSGFMLKQVNIKSYSSPFAPPKLLHSENLNGAGEADQVIMGDQLVGCPNIADCLVSRLIGGVRIVYHPGPIIYSSHTPLALNGHTKPMAVMLDGIIMGQGALSMVNPTDIYSIEMLESPRYFAIYGSVASGGLIVITTKRGDEGPAIVQPGLTVYRFKGYYKARQFYSPKYDAKKNANLTTDKRKTIWWNPNIYTDATGKATFEYFNAGSKGNYRVVVEGIDGDGKLARQVLTYRVDTVE